MKREIKIAFGALLVLLLAGCAMPENDAPPTAVSSAVETIYIQRQDRTLRDPVLPELLRQLKARGFQTDVFSGAPSAKVEYYLSYDGEWAGDSQANVVYVQADLYQVDKLLGSVRYDARLSDGAQSTSTADKIKPLLDALLQAI